MELKLELAQVNMILTALGKMPFDTVFQLVSEIQKQATEQLEQQKPSGLRPEGQ